VKKLADNQDVEQPKVDYSVGYGKPPLHSRFKAGQSGNPRGRPRGTKNRITILNQTLNERVLVTDNGKRKSITKQEAIFKQLVNKAASGDHRAAQLLLSEIRDVENRIGSTPSGREIIDEIDQQVVQSLLKRLGRQGDENDNGNDSNCE
jgi:Family of unknown function (DUF5681)